MGPLAGLSGSARVLDTDALLPHLTTRQRSGCPPDHRAGLAGLPVGPRLLENGTVIVKSQCGVHGRALRGADGDVTCNSNAIPVAGQPVAVRRRTQDLWPSPPGAVEISMESLILAQDERWRRASHMQVEREARACPGGKWRTGE